MQCFNKVYSLLVGLIFLVIPSSSNYLRKIVMKTRPTPLKSFGGYGSTDILRCAMMCSLEKKTIDCYGLQIVKNTCHLFGGPNTIEEDETLDPITTTSTDETLIAYVTHFLETKTCTNGYYRINYGSSSACVFPSGTHQSITYYDAINACVGQNAQVMAVNSMEKALALRGLLDKLGMRLAEIWCGLEFDKTSGTFKGVNPEDEMKIGDSAWGTDEPLMPTTDELCVDADVTKDNDFATTSCRMLRRYFCQQ